MKLLLFIFIIMVTEQCLAAADVNAMLKTNRNVEWLDKEIEKININLQEKHSFSTRRALEKQLEELKGRRKKVFIQFLEESSGVDIVVLDEGRSDKKEKLLDEVQDILLPLVESVKRLSAKPRQLEKIKNEISKLHELINNRKKAKESLLLIQNDEQYISSLPLINQGINELESEIIKLEIELDGKTRLVKKEENGKASFIMRLKEFLSDFVKTKGKNLFLSITTLIFLYWVLLVFRNQVFKFQIFTGKLEFIRKTLMTLYSSISMTIAFLGAIMVLYFLNDWLLLTLIVIVLLGILWSLKQYLPRYIGEARLILNIGPVKEDELITWEGVPYLVKSLGFSATLENPLLSGGLLRIPVQEFFNKQSRKIAGIIDWGGARIGDPDYDLWRPYSHYGSEFVEEFLKHCPHQSPECLQKKLDFFFRAQMIHRTVRQIMLGDQEMARWNLERVRKQALGTGYWYHELRED